jgi:hypothetical protein
MKTIKIIGLIVLSFLVLKELGNAYRQIGSDVIFIIIPFVLIIIGIVYFRKWVRKHKNKI